VHSGEFSAFRRRISVDFEAEPQPTANLLALCCLVTLLVVLTLGVLVSINDIGTSNHDGPRQARSNLANREATRARRNP